MHIREYETKSGQTRIEVSEPHPYDSNKRVWATGKGIREAKANLNKKIDEIKKGTHVTKSSWTVDKWLR